MPWWADKITKTIVYKRYIYIFIERWRSNTHVAKMGDFTSAETKEALTVRAICWLLFRQSTRFISVVFTGLAHLFWTLSQIATPTVASFFCLSHQFFHLLLSVFNYRCRQAPKIVQIFDKWKQFWILVIISYLVICYSRKYPVNNCKNKNNKHEENH